MGEELAKSFGFINGFKDISRICSLGETSLALGSRQEVSLLSGISKKDEQKVVLLEVKESGLAGIKFSHVVLNQEMLSLISTALSEENSIQPK